jgi:hypothetical protein
VSSTKHEAADPNTPPERLEELAAFNTAVQTLVAGNPNTPPRTLETLARSKSAAVQSAVTRNPNTPTATLLLLAPKDPQAFVQNPVLPLLELEDTHFTTRMTELDALSFVQHDAMTTEALNLLATHPSEEVQCQLALHPSSAPSLIRTLQRSPRPRVRVPATRHVNLSADPGTAWARLALEDLRTHHAALHRPLEKNPPRPMTLVQLLGIFHECSSWAAELLFTERFGRRTGMVNLTAHFGTHRNGELRAGAATHPLASASLLEALTSDRNMHVRRAAASNPFAPISVLEAMMNDPTDTARKGVAENPNAPVKLLEALSEDSNGSVRHALCTNPNLPAFLLEKLGVEDHAFIPLMVLQHPNTPEHVKIAIRARDLGSATLNPVLDKPAPTRLEETLRRMHREWKRKNVDPRVILLTLSADVIPETALERGVRSSDWWQRYALAANPRAPKTILERLSDSGHGLIRASARAMLARR